MIGALRHKVELLTSSRVDDGAGGASVIWTAGPELWARIERLTSSRDLAGDGATRLKRIAASIRYRPGIELGQRLRFDNDDYEVVSIESEDGREQRLTLICEEAAS